MLLNGWAALQRLQPLALVGERCLALTHSSQAEGKLVTASGAEHPLRRLCSVRTLLEHHSAINRSLLAAALQEELTRQNAAQATDALTYVVTYLAPTASRLNHFGAEESVIPVVPRASASDEFKEFDETLALAPAPQMPTPSFWLLGRIWLLREIAPAPRQVHVRLGALTLGCTGEYVLFRTLECEWRRQVADYLHRRVEERRQTPHTPALAELARARESYSRDGFVQYGDLLLVAGNPPLLGHVIPAHYNHSLSRESRQDLALAVPWVQPPRVHDLRVLEFTAQGGWRPICLPHGLCLGPGPKSSGGGQCPDPGLGVFAHLRWAAIRIADNGLFHEHDLQSDSEP